MYHIHSCQLRSKKQGAEKFQLLLVPFDFSDDEVTRPPPPAKSPATGWFPGELVLSTCTFFDDSIGSSLVPTSDQKIEDGAAHLLGGKW